MVAVRCPKEFAHIVQRAAGVLGAWPFWLVDWRHIGPVIRAFVPAPVKPTLTIALPGFRAPALHPAQT